MKRTHTGEVKTTGPSSARHIRWLPLSDSELAYCTFNNYRTCGQEGRDGYISRLRCGDGCTSSIDCNHLDHTPFWGRQIAIRQLGELCFPVLDSSPPNAPGSRLHFGSNTTFLQTFEEIRDSYRSRRNILDGDRHSNLEFITDDLQTATIFSINDRTKLPLEDFFNPSHLLKIFDMGDLDAQRIFEHPYFSDKILERLPLMGCTIAADLYPDLPYATISTLILPRPLSAAHWLNRAYQTAGNLKLDLTLPQAFACLAMFDFGTVNLEPSSLSEAFAMSSGNSIFVTSAFLDDPAKKPKAAGLQRIVGNIGETGISFLVAPPDPKTRPRKMDWTLVKNEAFDGKLENNFVGTSVHLSFTEYQMPLKIHDKDSHIIDRPARLIETVVSVRDQGNWVGDLNLLEALALNHHNRLERYDSSLQLERLQCLREICRGMFFYQAVEKLKISPYSHLALPITSIDSWDELLDPPQEGILVVRAQKNWLARLSLAGICWNIKFWTVVLPEFPCWSCLTDLLLRQHLPGLQDYQGDGQPRIVLIV
jgi:hypothetical protein